MKPALLITATIALIFAACTPEAPAPPTTEAPEEMSAPAEPKQVISREDFTPWPFTVDSGELRCVQWNDEPAVTFYSPDRGIAYGVNSTGAAMIAALNSADAPTIDAIWADDEEMKAELRAQGVTEGFPKVNLKPMIDQGLSLCGG